MRKKLFILLLLLVSVFAINVNAKGTTNFYAEDNLKLTSYIDATTFAAGKDVKLESEINGLTFVAGENLALSSKQDALFAAGSFVDLKNVSTKDAFLAGEKITLSTSQIRDLYAAAERVEINSNVSRNIYVAGDKVVINSEINGDVLVAAEKLEVTDNAVIKGTLKYPTKAKADISKYAKINETKTYVDTVTTTPTLAADATSAVLSFLSVLVIAFVLLWLFEKLYKDIAKVDFSAKTILKKSLLGFAAIIVIPLLAIIVMCTVIGLPIALITLALYIILLYLSIIPTAYYFGNKLFKDKISNKYLLMTVSILLIKVLELIPVIGFFVSLISLCLGFALAIELIQKRLPKTKKTK